MLSRAGGERTGGTGTMLVTEMWLQGPPRIPEDLPLALNKNPILKKASGHHHPCSGTGASQFFPNRPPKACPALALAKRVLTLTLGSAGHRPGLELPSRDPHSWADANPSQGTHELGTPVTLPARPPRLSL